MSLKIVIPSHKRHDRVFAKKLVLDPIICVAESQADLYRQYNPECEIVTHPDDVVGLIPKRNWMAKHFGELMMLDEYLRYHFQPSQYQATILAVRLLGQNRLYF